MADNILEVRSIGKRFGAIVAVDDVSFAVRRGEILGILGPNGAGKTTLFNLLTGYTKPDTGTVLLEGRSLRGVKPYKLVRRGIGRTFQLCTPFHGLTVLENVQIPCYGNDSVKGNQKSFALSLLRDVGLEDKADLDVSLLTYGDLRRLEIAKVIGTGPRLLMLDEPFAGLGLGEIGPIARLIGGLRESKGLTIIMIEHRLKEFMRLVDRVVAINFGSVIAEGTPSEIVESKAVIDAYLGSRGSV